MARTAVAYSKWVANANLADPAGTTADATNGHVINAAVPERTVLRVSNTAGSALAVTVKAGDYPPALASGQGDLAVTVAASTGVQFIGPFESGRFLQSDGSLQVDLAGGFAGKVTAFLLPAAA